MLGLFNKPDVLNGVYDGITYNISNAERTIWKNVELTFIFNNGECEIKGKGIHYYRHTNIPINLAASFNIENQYEYRLSVWSRKSISVYEFEIEYDNKISIRLTGLNSNGLLEQNV